MIVDIEMMTEALMSVNMLWAAGVAPMPVRELSGGQLSGGQLSGRELRVLEAPRVVACCAPLASEVVSVADAEALSRQFSALADPVRLRLLSLLATASGGSVCACELVGPAGKSQPTVSHHLKVLSEAGLVTSERRGRNIWYAVVPAALESLREILAPGQR